MKTYDNIGKLKLVKVNYTTGCVPDYNYFKKHKMIAIYLSKLQVLDADPKAIH